MLSKTSRYYKLPNFEVTNKQGRTIKVKALRMLPTDKPENGALLHTIEAKDRLDSLAHRYYQQSNKWWQICDANPKIMSPLELLDNASFVTTSFVVSFEGNTLPPWHELLKGLERFFRKKLLSNFVGIEEIKMASNQALKKYINKKKENKKEISNIKVIQTIKKNYERNKTNMPVIFQSTKLLAELACLPLKELLQEMKDNDYFKANKKKKEKNFYIIEKDNDDKINIYEGIAYYEWMILVTYNLQNIQTETLVKLITEKCISGFKISKPKTYTRLGQQIVIPPDNEE
jgi:hypothetical protein